MAEFLTVLFLLLVGHALADYPLQGDFLARAKNHLTPLPGVPWPWALAMHSLIHGGMVYLITGSLVFGLMEAILHACIDFAKNDGLFDLRDKRSPSSFSIDQWLHLDCKLVWALMTILVA